MNSIHLTRCPKSVAVLFPDIFPDNAKRAIAAALALVELANEELNLAISGGTIDQSTFEKYFNAQKKAIVQLTDAPIIEEVRAFNLGASGNDTRSIDVESVKAAVVELANLIVKNATTVWASLDKAVPHG